MPDSIKIGVLGCANIAQRSVIPAIKSLHEEFELVAVASRTLAKANEFANEFNCSAVEGYENLINSELVDALYIPLPTGLHKEWVNKALLAGKHVYAEKSIASNLLDAEEMVLNAEEMNLALMEGFMFQYHQQHQVVKDLINHGEIGSIRYFTSSFGFPPLGDDNFRYDEEIGGGALLDAAAYPARAVHFLLGTDFKVNGASVYYDPDLNTSIYGSAFLSDSKGIGAAISFGFDNFYQCSYEIWGEKGKISTDRAFTPRFDFSPTISIMKPEGTHTIKVDPENHFIKAFEEFYQTINNSVKRGKHFSEILIQSKTLEQIKRLSKSK